MNDKVVYGVYNHLSHLSDKYQKSIRDITYFSIIHQLYLNQETFYQKVIERNDIDTLIKDAFKTGSEWLFLVSYGQRFKDSTVVQRAINSAEKKNVFLVGHIIQTVYPNGSTGEGEFGLHHQNFLLNLRVWNEVGRPLFGKDGTYEIRLHIGERSQENFHDNYTPYWVKPTKVYRTHKGFLPDGWNLINTFLNKGYEVSAFNQEIKDLKGFLYPEDHIPFSSLITKEPFTEKLVNTDFNHSQKLYLSETGANNSSKEVYIFNTGTLAADIELRDIKDIKFHNIVCTASGFHHLLLLDQINWNIDSKIIFFDYSVSTLQFRKWLNENWDGINYYNALKTYKSTVQEDVLYLLDGTISLENSKQEIEAKFKELKEYLGGEEKWKKIWKAFTNLNKEYLEIDIIQDPTPLVPMLGSKKGNNVVWISNIFFCEPTLRYYTPGEISESYNNFTKSFYTNSNVGLIVGAQPITDWLYERLTE